MFFDDFSLLANWLMRSVVVVISLAIGANDLWADDPKGAAIDPARQTSDIQDNNGKVGNEVSSVAQRRQRLAEYLSDCDFVGRYTTDGQSGKPPKEERYTIRSCKVLDQPELYELKVRIRYGSVDSEVPLTVRIVFADQTPVITLDQIWIPGMGTFDARVMIRRDRYAGTWQHDHHGGHLFGVIEQREKAAQASDPIKAPESSDLPKE